MVKLCSKIIIVRRRIVLSGFPITSSWIPAFYIRGLIHGIGRGVPNDFGTWYTGTLSDCLIRGFDVEARGRQTKASCPDPATPLKALLLIIVLL